MPEYVRVKQPETGHELSMVASAAEAAGLKPLRKAATFPDGRPLPPKHHKPLRELRSKESVESTEATQAEPSPVEEGQR